MIPNDIHLYANGIVHCSVCVPKDTSRKEIIRLTNLINHTGIDSKWKISKDKKFANGNTNPCECEMEYGRLHYLMVC